MLFWPILTSPTFFTGIQNQPPFLLPPWSCSSASAPVSQNFLLSAAISPSPPSSLPAPVRASRILPSWTGRSDERGEERPTEIKIFKFLISWGSCGWIVEEIYSRMCRNSDSDIFVPISLNPNQKILNSYFDSNESVNKFFFSISFSFFSENDQFFEKIIRFTSDLIAHLIEHTLHFRIKQSFCLLPLEHLVVEFVLQRSIHSRTAHCETCESVR